MRYRRVDIADPRNGGVPVWLSQEGTRKRRISSNANWLQRYSNKAAAKSKRPDLSARALSFEIRNYAL
jgi:hypothetical protein